MKQSLPIGLALIALAQPAATQERGQFGFNLSIDPGRGAPNTTIGATWHITGRVALRPAIGFERRTAEQSPLEFDIAVPETQTPQAEVEETRWVLGGSLLFYVTRSKKLSTYIGVGYEYSRENGELRLREALPREIVELRPESSAHEHALSLFFGLQHQLSKSFGAFGELGLEYRSGSLEVVVPLPRRGSVQSDSKFDSFQTVSAGIGVIFYLN